MNYKKVYSKCRKYLDISRAEDATQDIWEKVQKHCPKGVNQTRYALGIVKNHCLNLMRDGDEGRMLYLEDMRNGNEDGDGWESVISADMPWEHPVEDSMVESDAMARALEIISVMPEKRREVVLMVLENGYDTDTVADKMGISVGAVHKHLQRAGNCLSTLMPVMC